MWQLFLLLLFIQPFRQYMTNCHNTKNTSRWARKNKSKIITVVHRPASPHLVFFYYFYLATSTTNWVQIFTGLLFYACWDTPSEETGLWQYYQRCPVSLKSLSSDKSLTFLFLGWNTVWTRLQSKPMRKPKLLIFCEQLYKGYLSLLGWCPLIPHPAGDPLMSTSTSAHHWTW